MSEYEYDKNKPGQAAGAGNETVSSDAGSGMTSSGRNAAPQNRGSGSDGAWENDDWSMRSSSVSDEDDPLIKLARLMEQNERNFEAAAQRSDTSGAGAPAAAYVPAADFAENQESNQAYHPEPQIAAAAPPSEPSYQDTGFVPASDLAGQGGDPYAASATTVAEAPASARPEQAAFRDPADEEQYDPFAPGGSAQPLPERDFDVSRIPRAIRPAVSVDQSQIGGLHGSASPDQTEPESIAEPVAAVRTAPAAMEQAAAPRPTSPLNEPLRPKPDPIAAELMRYVDANDAATATSSASVVQATSASGSLQENVAPEYQHPPSQPQPQPAAQPESQPQPASELGAASLPKADFSYLREVEDLRVPSRDAVNEEAANTSTANEDASSTEIPSTEEADILYDGYEEEDGGGLFASRGMMVAAGVMAFVLLGGGALLAYQAIFSGDDGGPPPLVLADKNPVRMLPDGQAADTSSGDIPLTSEGDVSNGVIQPGAETPIERINPNIDPDRAVRQIGANGNGTGSEGIAPRSVRTFKVNPDGSIVAEPATTNVSNSNAIQPRTVTTQQISGSGQVAAAPSDQSNGAPLPRARPNGASPAANTSGDSTGIQPRVVASNNTGTSGRADLPVAPRVTVGTNAPTFNQNAPTVQPATNTTTARVPSATVASTPAAPTTQPAAAAPAAATASGDFVVQVSSQRSEDAARTAFSGLQRRFPSVLGSLSPDIARADLGSRGVFYRVRVGPMETRVAAADFCQSLKSAGGDCIVARR